MRIFLLFLGIVLLTGCVSNKIYIVRHAEKEAEPADNPHLTQTGLARANDLSSVLHGKNIQQIFVTPLNRSVETAMPLSKRIKVPIQNYKNDTLLKFLVRVVQSQKNTLIVGHSNTVLRMLDELQIPHSHVREIPDNKFDYMFIVKVKSKNPGGYSYKLKETTYGKESPAPGDTLQNRSIMK